MSSALFGHRMLGCAAGASGPRCLSRLRLTLNYRPVIFYTPHCRWMGGGKRNPEHTPRYKRSQLKEVSKKEWVWTKFRMERVQHSKDVSLQNTDKQDRELVVLQSTSLNNMRKKVADFYKVDYKDLTREVLSLELWHRKLCRWIALEKYKQIATEKPRDGFRTLAKRKRRRKRKSELNASTTDLDAHKRLKETYHRELRMWVVRDKNKQLWDFQLKVWVAAENDEPLTTKDTVPKIRVKEVATQEWDVLEKHKRMTELSLRRIPKIQRIHITRMQKQAKEADTSTDCHS